MTAERVEDELELDECFLLLRAGGVLTLSDWRGLPCKTQAALAVAGEELARRRAHFVADAILERLSPKPPERAALADVVREAVFPGAA